jgi:hypothetical protein
MHGVRPRRSGVLRGVHVEELLQKRRADVLALVDVDLDEDRAVGIGRPLERAGMRLSSFG